MTKIKLLLLITGALALAGCASEPLITTTLPVTPGEKEVYAEAAAHPVKKSALFDTAMIEAGLIGSLGADVDLSCKIEVDLPALDTTALTLAAMKNLTAAEFRGRADSANAIINHIGWDGDVSNDAAFCINSTNSYYKTFRQMTSETIPALIRAGY